MYKFRKIIIIVTLIAVIGLSCGILASCNDTDSASDPPLNTVDILERSFSSCTGFYISVEDIYISYRAGIKDSEEVWFKDDTFYAKGVHLSPEIGNYKINNVRNEDLLLFTLSMYYNYLFDINYNALTPKSGTSGVVTTTMQGKDVNYDVEITLIDNKIGNMFVKEENDVKITCYFYYGDCSSMPGVPSEFDIESYLIVLVADNGIDLITMGLAAEIADTESFKRLEMYLEEKGYLLEDIYLDSAYTENIKEHLPYKVSGNTTLYVKTKEIETDLGVVKRAYAKSISGTYEIKTEVESDLGYTPYHGNNVYIAELYKERVLRTYEKGERYNTNSIEELWYDDCYVWTIFEGEKTVKWSQTGSQYKYGFLTHSYYNLNNLFENITSLTKTDDGYTGIAYGNELKITIDDGYLTYAKFSDHNGTYGRKFEVEINPTDTQKFIPEKPDVTWTDIFNIKFKACHGEQISSLELNQITEADLKDISYYCQTDRNTYGIDRLSFYPDKECTKPLTLPMTLTKDITLYIKVI